MYVTTQDVYTVCMDRGCTDVCKSRRVRRTIQLAAGAVPVGSGLGAGSACMHACMCVCVCVCVCACVFPDSSLRIKLMQHCISVPKS
jgi:hypothetical protein